MIEKMTLDLVRYCIEDDGIGYFIMNYTSSDSMPTPELKKAFEEADVALNKFNDLLNKLLKTEGLDSTCY